LEFERKFSALWEQQLRGDYLPERLLTPETRRPVIERVRADYLARLFDDSMRFAACEMTRRILGLAHVADLDSIADGGQRALCESRALAAARELLVNHRAYRNMAGVIGVMRSARTRAAI